MTATYSGELIHAAMSNWQVSVNTVETNTLSFIVRIWADETTDDGRWISWRGHVTQVPSSDRYYVDSLAEIAGVIASYIERLETEPPPPPESAAEEQ